MEKALIAVSSVIVIALASFGSWTLINIYLPLPPTPAAATPAVEVLPTIAPTNTAVPTSTPEPTETDVPTFTPAPTVEPTAIIIPTATPLDISYEILSIDTRVTEANSVWSKFAWIMSLRNDGPQTLIFDAEIKFLDEDGFIVEQDNVYDLTIGPHQTEDFNGYTLIDAGPDERVTNVTADTVVIDYSGREVSTPSTPVTTTTLPTEIAIPTATDTPESSNTPATTPSVGDDTSSELVEFSDTDLANIAVAFKVATIQTESFNVIYEEFLNLGETPSLFLDASWQATINTEFRKISQADGLIHTLPLFGAPSALFDILRESTAHYSESQRLITMAFVDPQQGYFEASAEQLIFAHSLTMITHDAIIAALELRGLELPDDS